MATYEDATFEPVDAPLVIQDETPSGLRVATQLHRQLQLTGVEVELRAVNGAAAEDPQIDIVQRLHEVLQEHGAAFDDAYYAAVDHVGQDAVMRSKANILLVTAPLLYEMRETQGWQRLINEQTGEPYSSWEDWLRSAMGMSHTKASNLITGWRVLLPMAVAQGIDLSTLLQRVDHSKLMLMVPIVAQHERDTQMARKTAARLGVPEADVILPPAPDLHALVELAQTETWEGMQQTLTHPGVEKTTPELTFTFTRLDDGRFLVQGTLTREECLYLERRVRPRFVDQATGLAEDLWRELREKTT